MEITEHLRVKQKVNQQQKHPFLVENLNLKKKLVDPFPRHPKSSKIPGEDRCERNPHFKPNLRRCLGVQIPPQRVALDV